MAKSAWFLVWFPVAFLLCLLSVTGQIHLYQTLDNHEDRITDLEQLVLNLTTSCSNLQQEYTNIKRTNEGLKTLVQNLTSRIQFLERVGKGQIVHGTDHGTTVFTTVSTTETTTPKDIPRDCAHAHRMGATRSGVYTIQPVISGSTYQVFCDLVNDGGGWTTIQRRVPNSLETFQRNWNNYKSGFGNISSSFWIGNDLLHTLSRQDSLTLHINLVDWQDVRRSATYRDFNVGSESSFYKLTVGQYHGNTGDSFHYQSSTLLRHDGMYFSTPDRDHDKSFQNCAQVLKAGWWFNNCYSSNLNGPQLNQPHGSIIYGESWGQPSLQGTGIEWYPWKKQQYSLKYTEMKIRPSNFI